MLDVAPPEAVVRRLVDRAAEVLGRQSTECVAAGRVNLIDIDAVAEALGPRWRTGKGKVYDHIEAVLTRALGESGYFSRVSPTDFLVVQPQAGEGSAQALCFRAFEEIWSHLLGEAARPGRAVHKVIDLSVHEIHRHRGRPQSGEGRGGAGGGGRGGRDRAGRIAGRIAALAAAVGPVRGQQRPAPGRGLPAGAGVQPQVQHPHRHPPQPPGVRRWLRARPALRRDHGVEPGRPVPDRHGHPVARPQRPQRARRRRAGPLPDRPGLLHRPARICASRQTFTDALGELRACVQKGFIFEVFDIVGARSRG